MGQICNFHWFVPSFKQSVASLESTESCGSMFSSVYLCQFLTDYQSTSKLEVEGTPRAQISITKTYTILLTEQVPPLVL